MIPQNKLHFVSRAFPPVIGGIENQNYAIFNMLKKHFKITSSINKKGKKALPFFLPLVTANILFLNNQTPVLLGDGVLTILSWISRKFRKKNRFICIVHGLDITFSNKIYQKLWIGLFFSSVDIFIAVSHHTKQILVSKGIDKDKIHVIPNGFDFNAITCHKDTNALNHFLKRDVSNKLKLITLGRLVKRKGVHWFLKNVVTQLDNSYIYIIAGDGPERENILNTINSEKLSDRVFFSGKVTEQEKQLLFSNCHLFVQPNIPVNGDVEGFGISVIEASSYKLPVIAANLEGLKDAITDNKNGWLVTPCEADEYIHSIERYKRLSEQEKESIATDFRNFSRTNYDWNIIIQDYISIINNQIP